MVGSLNLTTAHCLLMVRRSPWVPAPLPTELRLRLSRQQPRCLAAAVCTRSFLKSKLPHLFSQRTRNTEATCSTPAGPSGVGDGSRRDPLAPAHFSTFQFCTSPLPFLVTAAPAEAAYSCCRSRHQLRRRGRAKLIFSKLFQDVLIITDILSSHIIFGQSFLAPL